MSVHFTALSITGAPPVSLKPGSSVPDVPDVKTFCNFSCGSRIVLTLLTPGYKVFAFHRGAVKVASVGSVSIRSAQETRAELVSG